MRNTKPGTRVICIDISRTKSLGRGTYLGDFVLPNWNHPLAIARCEMAIGKLDATPLIDPRVYYKREAGQGRMTEAEAEEKIARAEAYDKCEQARPLSDRAWQHAASVSRNPMIGLDSGRIVWGCQSFWSEIDKTPPATLHAIEALPPGDFDDITPRGGPADLHMVRTHPALAHLHLQETGFVLLSGQPPAAALLSPCGTYRYALARTWGPGRHAIFIMLNPSTADAMKDDPTIRRCIGFAKRWECGGIVVVNAYALRSPDPAMLASHPDPLGPDNIKVLLSVLCADRPGPVVAAWGADPFLIKSGYLPVLGRVLDATGLSLQCLGTTKSGAPRHPLLLLSEQRLEPFTLSRT